MRASRWNLRPHRGLCRLLLTSCLCQPALFWYSLSVSFSSSPVSLSLPHLCALSVSPFTSTVCLSTAPVSRYLTCLSASPIFSSISPVCRPQLSLYLARSSLSLTCLFLPQRSNSGAQTHLSVCPVSLYLIRLRHLSFSTSPVSLSTSPVSLPQLYVSVPHLFVFPPRLSVCLSVQLYVLLSIKRD